MCRDESANSSVALCGPVAMELVSQCGMAVAYDGLINDVEIVVLVRCERNSLG